MFYRICPRMDLLLKESEHIRNSERLIDDQVKKSIQLTKMKFMSCVDLAAWFVKKISVVVVNDMIFLLCWVHLNIESPFAIFHYKKFML